MGSDRKVSLEGLDQKVLLVSTAWERHTGRWIQHRENLRHNAISTKASDELQGEVKLQIVCLELSSIWQSEMISSIKVTPKTADNQAV
jgi:hypothetical protein